MCVASVKVELDSMVCRQEGLTLLQVLIGLIIFSLFFLPFLQMEKLNEIGERRDEEVSRIEHIEQELVKYAARVGYYPAPADPSIAVTDVSALHGRSIPIAVPAIPDCTAGAPTLIDLNADGAGVMCTDARGGATDDVYIGTLPITELGLNLHNGLDPFGNKYTYIVSRNLVDLQNVVDAAGNPDQAGRIISNDNNGSIQMFNENGPGVAGDQHLSLIHI